MARSRKAPPESPTELGRGSWWQVLKRTAKEFGDDNLTDWAAALTYHGVLSIFPAILVIVSLLDLFGQSTVDKVVDEIGSAAPNAVHDILVTATRNLQDGQNTAGFLAIIGLVGGLWSASNYVGAFMRASNAVYDVSPGGILAVVIWLAASAGFAIYVANFSSYNKTYGTLAGVIVFLVWLWISNLAILLGAEFDAELHRSRAIQAGHPESEEPLLDPESGHQSCGATSSRQKWKNSSWCGPIWATCTSSKPASVNALTCWTYGSESGPVGRLSMSDVTSWLACSKCFGCGNTCANSPGSSSFGQSRCAVSSPSSTVGAWQTLNPPCAGPFPPASR